MDIQSIKHLDDVTSLLASLDLPSSDLTGKDNLCLFGIYNDNQLIASAGIEMMNDLGLLRSVAVKPSYQNQGIAKKLVTFTEAWAKERGITELYLLTTSATEFFKPLDYVLISRSDTPQLIKETTQFSQLCPCSSSVMKKSI